VTNNKAPDVQELLKKLIAHNILPSNEDKSKQAAIAAKQNSDAEAVAAKLAQAQQLEKERLAVPDLTSFDSNLLKQKYDGAIRNLYSGIQCAQCGNRFHQQQQENSNIQSSSGQSRYSKHLDWHFRQNKKEKEEINKAHSRPWYYDLREWVYYEELSEDVLLEQESVNSATGNANSNNTQTQNDSLMLNADGIAEEDLLMDQSSTLNFDKISCLNISSINPSSHSANNNNNGGMNNQNGNKNSNVSSLYNGVKTCAATDDIGDSCNICNDPFEIFWYAEREQWHFKDAIRVDNKIYHPICFEDAREVKENF
jgi:hypothetical protein